MRQITITFTVCTFDELSEHAQARAIDVIREKLDGPWWDTTDNDDLQDLMVATLAEKLDAPGWNTHGVADLPGITGVRVDGWDITCSDSLAVTGILTRDNAPALPWVGGIDHVELTGYRSDTTTIAACDSDPDCTCSPDHYLVPHDDGCPSLVPSPVTDEHHAALQQAARDALNAAWSAGERSYEHKIGEEWAREVAGDYEFTVDGEFYR